MCRHTQGCSIILKWRCSAGMESDFPTVGQDGDDRASALRFLRDDMQGQRSGEFRDAMGKMEDGGLLVPRTFYPS